MPSLTITKDPIQVHVDFNGYASAVNYEETSFRRADISLVDLSESNGFVRVIMASGSKFDVSYTDTAGALKVGLIDGVVPTSNSDLRDKINALVL